MRVIFYGLLVVLCAWPQLTFASGGDAVKGKALYEKNCKICHGPEGKGDGPAGRVSRLPATDFTTSESRGKSEDEWLKTISGGRRNTTMPAFKGRLSEQEIREVLGYIRSLNQ